MSRWRRAKGLCCCVYHVDCCFSCARHGLQVALLAEDPVLYGAIFDDCFPWLGFGRYAVVQTGGEGLLSPGRRAGSVGMRWRQDDSLDTRLDGNAKYMTLGGHEN